MVVAARVGVGLCVGVSVGTSAASRYAAPCPVAASHSSTHAARVAAAAAAAERQEPVRRGGCAGRTHRLSEGVEEHLRLRLAAPAGQVQQAQQRRGTRGVAPATVRARRLADGDAEGLA